MLHPQSQFGVHTLSCFVVGTHKHAYIYIYICMCVCADITLKNFEVTLKKVYDRKVVIKYRLYLLLGVVIFNLIDYIYIYTWRRRVSECTKV